MKRKEEEGAVRVKRKWLKAIKINTSDIYLGLLDMGDTKIGKMKESTHSCGIKSQECPLLISQRNNDSYG